MNASDITTQYYTKEFEKLYTGLKKHFSSYSEFLLTLALCGYHNKNAVPLNSKNGEEKHNFSIRTVYTRDSLELDANFGLLTILNNSDKNYDKVLNSMAFKKNNNGEAFATLVNVNTFFSNLLGGIKPLYDSLDENEGLDSDEQLFDNLLYALEDIYENVDQALEELLEKENTE